MADIANLDTEQRISIVLKEYDALRKEIDDRLNAPKLYFVPLLFVLLAGAMGWKADAPIDLVLLFIIPIFLTFMSFVLNAGYYLQRSGERIARIEDSVFKLSGLPLLSHETQTILERKGLPVWVSNLGLVIGAFLYVVTESFLFFALGLHNADQIHSNPGRLSILVFLLSMPLVLFAISGIRLIRIHRSTHAFRSGLLAELEEKGFDNLLGAIPTKGNVKSGKPSTKTIRET